MRSVLDGFHDLFRSQLVHTVMVTGAMLVAMQRAGATIQRNLKNLIVLTAREKTPCFTCRPEKGDNRCAHACGKMHGTGVSGNKNPAVPEQGAGLTQGCFVGKIVPFRQVRQGGSPSNDYPWKMTFLQHGDQPKPVGVRPGLVRMRSIGMDGYRPDLIRQACRPAGFGAYGGSLAGQQRGEKAFRLVQLFL